MVWPARLDRLIKAQQDFKALGLALMFGLAAALSLPPFGFWAGLFMAMPAIYSLAEEASPRHAFALGWSFGLGYFLLTLHWIGFAFFVNAAHDAWMMPFAVLGLVAFLSLYWGLAFLVAALFRLRGMPGFMLLSACLALAEHGRGLLFTGFPWGEPGLAALSFGPLAQTASLVGMEGLTLLLFLWGGCWIFILRGDETPLVRLAGSTILATLVLALIFGALRLSQQSAATSPPIFRLVQPAVPQDDKWLPSSRREIFARLLNMSRKPPVSGTAPQVIIWPEAAIPYLLNEQAEILAETGAMLGQDRLLITGGLRRQAGPEGDLAFNSVFLISSPGRIIGTYDKVRLVPGGEFLPFESLLSRIGFRRLVDLPGSFTAGASAKVLQLPGVFSLSPSICYEAIFPYSMVPDRERPRLLVNVTNDAWFGRSIGPYAHLAQARIRSIELGLPMMRAANTGISAVIDSYGRILATVPLGIRDILDTPVPAALPPTYFAKFGVLSFWCLVFTTILLACLAGQVTLTNRSNRD